MHGKDVHAANASIGKYGSHGQMHGQSVHAQPKKQSPGKIPQHDVKVHVNAHGYDNTDKNSN